MFESDKTRVRASEPVPPLRVIPADHAVVSHWGGLSDAENEARFCAAWLSSQCSRISGAMGGLLMMPPPAKGISATSTSWPEQNPHLQELMRIAERASLDNRTVAAADRNGSGTTQAQAVSRLLVALPLGPGNQPIAVAAVAVGNWTGPAA